MSEGRVLVLIKGLGVGGAEVLLANSIPHWNRGPFEYEVAYMLPWKDDLVGDFEHAGIPVHQIGGGRGSIVTAVNQLKRLIRDRKIDLVDAHLPIPGIVARFAALRADAVSVVYHEHSLSVQRQLHRGRFLAFLANVTTYGMNDVIVAVSNDTARDVRRFNVSGTPVRVVLNGIPLPSKPSAESIRAALGELGVPVEHRVVGHVAKMTSKKRQSDLILAAAEVLRRLPDTTFLLIGKGELRPRLEQQVRDLGLERQILLPGFVEDLTKVMAGFDVFLLTSDHEGLPTVVIEAHSLGVPAVATDVGGTREIVRDGVTGFLVPARNPGSIANALIRMLDDDQMRLSMGIAAEESSGVFDVARCVRETEEVYRQLLDRPKFDVR